MDSVFKTYAAITIALPIGSRQLPEAKISQTAGIRYRLVFERVYDALKYRDHYRYQSLDFVSNRIALNFLSNVHLSSLK